MKPIVFVLSLVLLSTPVLAEEILSLDEDFQSQRQAIEREFDSGSEYSEISQRERRQVLTALDRIGNIVESMDSIDSLTPPQRVALFNHQEEVNTILLAAREDSRVVCTRRAITGSRRHESFCETVAERRERGEHDRDMMSSQSPRVQQLRD